MKDLLEWIDRVNALRAASPGALRSHLYLTEQILEDEANSFRTRVLIRATNILMDDKELEPENGVYRVNFT